MIITTNIKMDFLLRGIPPQVEMMQDDQYSRNLAIAMYAGGVAWKPETDVGVQVHYVKADGTGGTYDTLPDDRAACTITDNVLTAALAPQVLTCPGRVRLSVSLISGNVVLNTFEIPILVRPNPGLAVVSEDYYKVTGSLAESGWTPNMYLGTDENGNVVTKAAPEVPAGGATVEEVLEAIPMAVGVAIAKSGSTITVTTALDDGQTSTSRITLNASGYPSQIVTDGVTCPVSWEGFDG